LKWKAASQGERTFSQKFTKDEFMKIQNVGICLVFLALFATYFAGCYEHPRSSGVAIEVHDSTWHHTNDADHGAQWDHDHHN
jgi:hypothetical protein